MPLHPQVQMLLDGMAAQEMPPLDQLDPSAARELIKAFSALSPVPEDVHHVDDRTIETDGGDLPIRVYTPRPTTVGDEAPVLVWFHGGGWVIGDLDTTDATCRMLANRSDSVVVSVDYRLAPEHPFPAGLEDCVAAVTWTVENAELLGVDPTRLAVGGDSAGGNLAAVVAQRNRDEFGPAIRFQLLVYPATDLTMSHPSVKENGEGYFLTHDAMVWFVGHYLSGGAEAKDPLVSPLFADSATGLPPALIITAEFDPLRDEGEAYGAWLEEAGVPAAITRYDGQIHGFFGMVGLLDGATEAIDEAATALRAALA